MIPSAIWLFSNMYREETVGIYRKYGEVVHVIVLQPGVCDLELIHVDEVDPKKETLGNK